MTYSLNTLNVSSGGADAPRSGAARFGQEVALLLGLLVIVLWLMALISYHPQDAAWSTSGVAGGRSPANWAGHLGAWMADGSYFLFGFSIWWGVAAAARAWLSALACWMHGTAPGQASGLG